jgi:hypothetical protein
MTTVDSNVFNDNNVEMSVVLDQSVDSNKLLNEHISQMQPFYLMRSTPRKILFYLVMIRN